ncbi:MAG: sugar phosphate isomerase/epimerase family protein [Anaerolineae bacterium]
MKPSYMLMGDPRADDGSVQDWHDTLLHLKGVGLEGVDLFARYLERVNTTPDEAVAFLRDNGLEPAVYCVHTDFITPGADIQASLDTIRRGAEVCTRHGIGHLFSAGGQHTNQGPEAMSRYVEGLQKALEITQSAGLLFSIENAGRMCHTWEQLKECVERVGPEMKVTLDGGNFILAGSDPIKAAVELADRVVHVHVKNFVPAPNKEPYPFEYTRPSEGITDYPLLVGILAGAEFDGYLAFEPEGWPNAPADDGVRFCAELARSHVARGH